MASTRTRHAKTYSGVTRRHHSGHHNAHHSGAYRSGCRPTRRTCETEAMAHFKRINRRISRNRIADALGAGRKPTHATPPLARGNRLKPLGSGSLRRTAAGRCRRVHQRYDSHRSRRAHRVLNDVAPALNLSVAAARPERGLQQAAHAHAVARLDALRCLTLIQRYDKNINRRMSCAHLSADEPVGRTRKARSLIEIPIPGNQRRSRGRKARGARRRSVRCSALVGVQQPPEAALTTAINAVAVESHISDKHRMARLTLCDALEATALKNRALGGWRRLSSARRATHESANVRVTNNTLVEVAP